MARPLSHGEGDPASPPTILAGAIFLASLVLIVVGLEAMYYHAENAEWDRKVLNEQPEELRKVRADQTEHLTSYRWVDAPNHVVAIPIDRAIELEVRDLGGTP